MTARYMGPRQISLFARQDIVESDEIARLIEGVHNRRQGSILLVGAADASQPPRISEAYLDLGLRICTFPALERPPPSCLLRDKM